MEKKKLTIFDRLSKTSVQSGVAVVSILFAFIVMLLLIFFPVPERNRDLFNTLIGMVIGGTLTGVIGWLYTTKAPDTPANNNQNTENADETITPV